MESGYEESVGLFFVIKVSHRYRNVNPHHIPFNTSDSDGIIPCFEGVDGPPQASSMR